MPPTGEMASSVPVSAPATSAPPALSTSPGAAAPSVRLRSWDAASASPQADHARQGLRKLNLPTLGATQAAAEAAAAAMGSPSFSRMDRSTSLGVSDTVPVDAERTRYFRRLSALPPVAPHMPDIPKPVLKFVDATRGILFALSQIYSALHQHMAVSTDERLVAHFQRVLSIAARSMSALITVLDRWDHSSQAGMAESSIVRQVLDACNESVRTFRRAVTMLHTQLPQLGQSVDVRFTRTLLLLLYGSMAELKNSADMMLPQAESVMPFLSTDTSQPGDNATLARDSVRMRGPGLQDVSMSQDGTDTSEYDVSVPATSTPLSKRSMRVRPGITARSLRDPRKSATSTRALPASPSHTHVLRSKPSTASLDELDDTLSTLLVQVTEHAMTIWTELGAYVNACLRQEDDHDENRLRRLRDVQEACQTTLEHTRCLQATHERFSDDHVRTTGANVHQLWEEANQFVRVRISPLNPVHHSYIHARACGLGEPPVPARFDARRRRPESGVRRAGPPSTQARHIVDHVMRDLASRWSAQRRPATRPLGMDDARPRAPADDAQQTWSEEEGEDLMKDSGNLVGLDSSDEDDEDDEDEEEQRRIAEGFIDDNDEEEDNETTHKRKRRHRHREMDEELDEDDLALLSENTRPAQAPHKRARAEGQSNEELAHIFDDEDTTGAAADPYDDELDDFIEDDEDDAELTGLDEEQREARRRERREERRQARMSGARVDPRKAGVDLEAWDEVHDIFGNGEDYAWALEEEEETSEAASKGRMEYKDIFEPAQIRERMLTDEDDRIKQVDMPERLQLMIPGEEGLQLLERKLSEAELDEAAHWASTRLSPRCTAEFLDDMAPHARLRGEWHACVRQMLSYLLNDLLEVPFLMQHRLDELEHTQDKVTITLLVRQELLALSTLGIKYKQLLARKDALRKTFHELVATFAEPTPELEEARTVVDELVAQAATLEEVTDIAEWLAARFGERFREATALASSHEAPVLKRPTVVSEYEQRKHTPLAQLAVRLGLSSSQLAANVSGGIRQHVPEDEAVPPLTVAEEYVHTVPGAIDASATLALARTLLAHEIGKEPALRREVRSLFRLSALVDVEPTERGMTAIDEGHPYYHFKFLRAKPISAVLQNASQFLQMVQAEEERLITLTLRLPFETATKLEHRLQEQFVSDGMSAVSQVWNEQRQAVVEEACAAFLLPLGRMWTHEWLVEECREALLRYCEQRLTQRVEGGPVQSAGMISRQADPSLEAASRVPRVLALSHGDGDPRRSEIVAVFLDERGRLLERATFDTLRPPRATDEGVAHDPRAAFVDLLRRRRPDVVVVNGFSPRTAELKEEVHELVSAAWEERVRDEELDGLAREQVRMDVVSVYDDVARLYQHSARAATEFPELPVLARYCVGLARYAQSPVNEFAALGADVVAVQFDPAQRLLPGDRLRMHLERALVLLVNDIGVDIQAALTDTYVGAMLPFVAGLGPRKAHALLHAIRTQLDGVVVNREVLVRRSLLPFHVWNNAASFLRIDQEAATDALDEEAQPDVLDSTRIHPEDYDFPRQMARDALNKHEEDLEGEHPSVACVEIMHDAHPTEKLAALDLDQYAAMLYERRGLKKRLTLLACKQELIRPYDDWRPAQTLPNTEELFTMFTGETRRTLSEGYVVPAVVYRVEEGRDMEGFLRVRLEAGIEGIIAGRDIMPGYNSRDVRLRRLFRAGQTLNAVVVQLDLHRMRAELSLRAEAFEHVNPAQGRTPVDPMYFDHERAHMESEAAEERARRRHQNRIGRRVIDHPHFHNLNAAQAQHFLATQPRGSVVVRPSSRGMDHLAVTWKVDEGVFQHIDVLELDKDNDHALGRILRVADMGSYVDLDDLIVNHVRPMAAMVEMMMNHEKYKGADPAAVEAYLTNASLANPTRSVYAFGLNKERPGYFDLSFKANSSAPVQTWPVKVLPGAFKLGQATQLADVAALTNAFKTQYMAQVHAARGGRTPGVHGGMTPGYYGGRTPGAAYHGGMTPRTAYGGMGSMTPGAYGAPLPGPPPAPYGMPPGPPPAMPSRGPW